VQDTTPEKGSLPLNATLTGCVNQPLFVGCPTGPPLTAGGVVSILSETLFVAVSPASLVAEHVTVVPAVSAASVIASQPDDEVIGLSASATVHDTETALVYQPLAPEVPAIDGVIVGGVVSAPSSTAACGDAATTRTASTLGTNAAGRSLRADPPL
jgi:hypothetical protein